MRTHVPFRNWCGFCIKGKCKSDPHYRSNLNREDPIADGVATIAIGYTFPRQGKANRAEQGGMPIIVMKNNLDKWVSAFVVPDKGLCEYAVKAVSRGYNMRGTLE